MTTIDSVYLSIYPKGVDVCFGVPEWYEQATRTWRCAGCSWIKQWDQPIDAHIQESRPPGRFSQWVDGCGLCLLSTELLDLIPDDTRARELMEGNVWDADGRVIPDWRTVVARNRVILRGSKRVALRRCTECGRNVYTARELSSIFPPPPGDIDVFGSDRAGIVVSSRIADRFHNVTAKYVTRNVLTVQEPADGYGPLTL